MRKITKAKKRRRKPPISAADAVDRYRLSEKRIMRVSVKSGKTEFSVSDLTIESFRFGEVLRVPDGYELVLRRVHANLGAPDVEEPRVEVIMRPYLVPPDSAVFPATLGGP